MAQKVIVQNVRFSYAHVFQPHAFEGDAGKEPKYSVTLLIPKTSKDTVAKVEKAINAAYEEAKLGIWHGKQPRDWFNPLQDGDEPDRDGQDRGEAYHGHYFINAKSRTKPGLVDANLEPIIDPDGFKSGDYGHASIAFSGFDRSGNKGISAFLNNIMKTKDGEALGSGAATAEEDFADLVAVEDL